MENTHDVQAYREGQAPANGDLEPSKPHHPAVAEGSSAGHEVGVTEGNLHGMPLQGSSHHRPERPQAAGVGDSGLAGLTTPPATYQRVPTATGGGGVSSAGSTPRGAGQGALLYEGSPLHGRARSPRAPGLQTFGAKYMPFAAGFAQMASEAPVYRSSRLHTINPTAAINEDTSYLWTLDSGMETPATRAANPNRPHAEHVRNTSAGTGGGVLGKLFGPIK